jgi:hypothetical protein
MARADGWTSDGRLLVERAIDIHGGQKRWRAAARIDLPFRSGSGVLLRLKGYGLTFHAPRAFEVRPHERVTVFHGYPDEDHHGRFVDGTVAIEHVERRVAPTESANHRHTFTGVAKYRCWSPMDALYFFGYALCHYHALPFTLPQTHLVRVLRARGKPVGVEVIVPLDVHTHCRRQRIYFGEDGRIVRHDYVADVIGSWARGAHYWEDYANCDGLLIARRRRVVARVGAVALPVTVLCIQLGEPAVHR